MFQIDEEKFLEAEKKNLDAIEKIEDKKKDINKILGLDIDNYEKKEKLEQICYDLLDIKKELEELDGNIKVAKQRMNEEGTYIELDDVFKSEIIDVDTDKENSDDNQDEIDEIVKVILGSNDYTDSQKEEIRINYENKKIVFQFPCHCVWD